MLAEVPAEVLATLEEAANELATSVDGKLDEKLRENHLFAGLYGQEYGFFRNKPDNRAQWIYEYGDHAWSTLPGGTVIQGQGWVRRRRRMRRREWIEKHVLIKGKGGRIEPLVLNEAQRLLESKIIRMERAGMPVRIVILKARQIGFSTYIEAVAFEMIMRREHAYALLVAHRRDTATKILRKMHVMRDMIAKLGAGQDTWDFRLQAKARDKIEFGSPQSGSIGVDSSESESPGHGETVDILHMTETSRWKNAEESAKGAESIVPDFPGTYAFDETTAAGDWGYFRDKFWLHWTGDGNPEGEKKNDDLVAWISLFVGWFENPQYRLTFVRGWSELPEDVADRIEKSMDTDEQRVFGQRFYQRRYGWRNVDLDQIGWYQYVLKAKCGGKRDTRAEQYPSEPNDAFLATGRPAFNREHLKDLIAKSTPPIWRGDLIEYAGGMTLEQEEAADAAR